MCPCSLHRKFHCPDLQLWLGREPLERPGWKAAHPDFSLLRRGFPERPCEDGPGPGRRCGPHPTESRPGERDRDGLCCGFCPATCPQEAVDGKACGQGFPAGLGSVGQS